VTRQSGRRLHVCPLVSRGPGVALEVGPQDPEKGMGDLKGDVLARARSDML